MTSEVDICNMALGNIGSRGSIATLNERSNEAIKCKTFYEITRKEILRAAPWNFAKRDIVLSLLAAASGTPENPDGSGAVPPTPWAYMYSYPAYCLKARYIKIPGREYYGTNLPAIPFQVTGADDGGGNDIRAILANQQAAELVYTKDITNPDVFDEEFTVAFAQALAARICLPLNGDKAMATGLAEEARKKVYAARMTDGNEGTSVIDTMPDWLSARGVEYGEYNNGSPIKYW